MLLGGILSGPTELDLTDEITLRTLFYEMLKYCISFWLGFNDYWVLGKIEEVEEETTNCLHP